eukprot:439886-Prymnesium_polylepis.1
MQIGLPKNVVQPLGPSAARSILHRDFMGRLRGAGTACSTWRVRRRPVPEARWNVQMTSLVGTMKHVSTPSRKI